MCSMLQGLFVTDFMSGHRLDGMDGKPIYQKEQRVNMRALVPSTNLSEKDFFLNTHEFQPHSSYRRSRHPKDSCGLQEKPVTQGLVSRARSEPVSEAIPSPQVCRYANSVFTTIICGMLIDSATAKLVQHPYGVDRRKEQHFAMLVGSISKLETLPGRQV